MNNSETRRDAARRVRNSASELAFKRAKPKPDHPSVLPVNEIHKNNGEELKYRAHGSFMSFSKGLKHSSQNGLPEEGEVTRLRGAIDSGLIQPFDAIGIGCSTETGELQWQYHTHLRDKEVGSQHRRWEAPTAGFVYDLQGPDAQAVTMPVAPALEPDCDELAAEMAEVYELALLRDEPFKSFSEVSTTSHCAVEEAVDTLKKLPFYQSQGNLKRTRPAHLSKGNVFRGQTPGEQIGPYISQFLLLGNCHLESIHEETSGFLQYGSIRIDHRVRTAQPDKDYMTHWNEWLDVQHGADVISTMDYVSKDAHLTGGELSFRYITSPRDLATYVHFDALYEAYLNACLWLLNVGAPLDPNFANKLGQSSSTEGFALFGGPHILNLVTEVATRALKAVRFQKFNNHLRARPEVVAARISASEFGCLPGEVDASVRPLVKALSNIGLLERVKSHNETQNVRHGDYLSSKKGIAAANDLPLLPMAFAEGSPMHPAYGAGHATVAGACVTMLKAFFDEDAVLIRDRDGKHKAVSADNYKNAVGEHGWEPFSYVATDDGSDLEPSGHHSPLTVGHELNKLAGNISIGRNMGGVHYYSDYIESMRMGEAIATGILEEQALTYEKIDDFVLGFRSFDDQPCRIKKTKSAVTAKFA